MTSRILLLPHVGSALGHLIRCVSYAHVANMCGKDVSIVIPQDITPAVRCLIPNWISIVTRKSRFTVNNSTGEIDYPSVLSVQAENEAIVQNLKPDLIIDSPGLSGAIIGETSGIDWLALSHGCYLPFPEYWRGGLAVEKSLEAFAFQVWRRLRNDIDKIVSTASRRNFPSWSELLRSANLIVPNSRSAEPCIIGRHRSLDRTSYGFHGGNPARCLITMCSDRSSNAPPMQLLRHLAVHYGNLVTPIDFKDGANDRMISSGRYCRYDSLVSEETTVISHGGYGTLQMLTEAHKVFLVPGDFDQLYNSLVAHRNLGFELMLSKKWLRKVESSNRYKRHYDWNVLRVTKEAGIEGRGILEFEAPSFTKSKVA